MSQKYNQYWPQPGEENSRGEQVMNAVTFIVLLRRSWLGAVAFLLSSLLRNRDRQ